MDGLISKTPTSSERQLTSWDLEQQKLDSNGSKDTTETKETKNVTHWQKDISKKQRYLQVSCWVLIGLAASRKPPASKNPASLRKLGRFLVVPCNWACPYLQLSLQIELATSENIYAFPIFMFLLCFFFCARSRSAFRGQKMMYIASKSTEYKAI